MGAALFRRAGTKGQVSRRASAFVDEGSSVGDNLVDGSSHTSSVDSSEPKTSDQLGSDEYKTKNGEHCKCLCMCSTIHPFLPSFKGPNMYFVIRIKI